VRSFAGLDLSEFLLPLLVADRICNGSEKEFDQIRQEFVMILDFDSLETSPVMSLSERRKAVNAFFCILDTLAYWEERDTEDECRKFRHSKRKSPEKERGRGTGSHWPLEETKTQIRKMRESLPLLLLAKAASGAGMHARALKISELLARSAVVADYFEANDGVKDQEWQGSILHRPLMDAIPVPLMRKALADLDDCETMSSLGQDVSLPSLLLAADSIRAYEAEGNYDGALLRYELALGVKDSQTSSDQAALERGVLGCLLQLGKFESVLSRVESQHLKDSAQTKVYAIEAAWRLGEWDTLSGLIKAPLSGELCGGFDDTFQMSLGRAISSVYHCNYEQAKTDMRTAKESVMGSLSTVARESYAKSYEFLVQLHQIREVEDSFIYFTQDSQSPKLRLEHMAGSVGPQGWFWNGRLHFPTPKAASTIIQTRLAIARLAKDSLYESSLLLQMGRHARKNGLSYAAESFLCSAEATLMGLSCEEGQDIHHLAGLVDEVRNQYAKLKKQSGDNSMALNILNQGATELCFKELMRVEKSASNVNRKLKKIAVAHEAEQIREMFKREPRPSKYSSDSVLAERYARRLLRVTQWTVDSGVQDGAVVERFEVVIKLSAKWEKGMFLFTYSIFQPNDIITTHLLVPARFTFARYLNNVISRTLEKELHGESNDNAVRFNALYRDKACQNFILLAMENYTECLFLDSKHLYQALPRLLSLWFDFVSVSEPSEASRAYSKDRIGKNSSK
jgi:serine/threonine-protein kinase ATR